MSRLRYYLIEGDPEYWDGLKHNLLSKCKSFIKEIKSANRLIYRGSKRNIDLFKILNSHVDYRTPKDMDSYMHDELNYWFEKKFGWKVRNGVFVTSKLSDANQYGKAYIFFPIGEYKYVWSDVINDLYHYRENGKLNTSEELEDMYYNDDDIRYLIKYDIVENSIMDYIFDYKNLPEEEGKYKLEAKQNYPKFGINKGDIVDVEVYKRSFDEWLEDNYSNGYTPKYIVEMYDDKNIKKAIVSGNEISFSCDEYYLINRIYEELILEMIDE